MKHSILYFVFLLIFPLPAWCQNIVLIKVDGVINQVSASFIHEEIEKAHQEKAQCLIIELNTPGGVLESTRTIVSDILSSPIPIVVYVAPSGAHAGSAGVFITLAANLAAMAPGTNIGAAHPVAAFGQSDSIMNIKATNDAAAFIRSIAEKRNRNLDWAEEAVRNSLSITENEALENNIIDLIAVNEQELLQLIDGQTIELTTEKVTLQTKNARIVYVEMSSLDKLLNFISDPNIAYILLLLGLFGILFELFNPGAILPGVVGVISLILAFYAMQALAINYAGLALIIFALVLFILEIKIVSHGILAIGGIISLLFGSMMLFRSSSSLDMIAISTSIIISATAITSALFLFAIGMGLKAQRLKPATGAELLIGELGEPFEELNPTGQVQVNGVLWKAQSISGRIKKGEKVRVTSIKGLTLLVEKITI
jgi:membrane-bound serine protease (ClpP class)